MKTLIALSLLLSTLAATSAQAEICYGGPGNYPYTCPKPEKPAICHGGPGNYPYPCPRN